MQLSHPSLPQVFLVSGTGKGIGMKLGAHFQTRLALALAFLSHMLGEDTQAHIRGAGKTRIVVEHMPFPYAPESFKARILVWVLPLQFYLFFS